MCIIVCKSTDRRCDGTSQQFDATHPDKKIWFERSQRSVSQAQGASLAVVCLTNRREKAHDAEPRWGGVDSVPRFAAPAYGVLQTQIRKNFVQDTTGKALREKAW
jgi:hypothetical protein